MQSSDRKVRFADEIKNKKYIDNYINRWLKLETLDRPYVECEICGYASNASIHQHLLIPEGSGSKSSNNRIVHLCANCHYELRALIDKHSIEIVQERRPQIYDEAFEELRDKKKHYREMNQRLERIEI